MSRPTCCPAFLPQTGSLARAWGNGSGGCPDPRSPLGRWHPLGYVLGLAVCAFTAAGHDSPVAIAEWAAGCSREILQTLGGRRDPWTRRIKARHEIHGLIQEIAVQRLRAAPECRPGALQHGPAAPGHRPARPRRRTRRRPPRRSTAAVTDQDDVVESGRCDPLSH